jgi:predicted nucleic acid-binding protein
MKAFVDADILIWHLRGHKNALSFLQDLRASGDCELWVGAMQRAEVVFFMRPEEEDGTMLFLSQFKTAVVDQAVVDQAAQLYRKWNPSHGIDPNDALLAAATMLHGGYLYCLNRKHYPMPGLAVKHAW